MLCDRTTPTCQRCFQSGRVCLGYGLRLSWPGKNQRRSLTAHPLRLRALAGQTTTHQGWINTFFSDVHALYQNFAVEESVHMQRIATSNAIFYSDPQTATWVNAHDFTRYGNSMTLPISARTLNWIPYQLDAELATLLDYCKFVPYA